MKRELKEHKIVSSSLRGAAAAVLVCSFAVNASAEVLGTITEQWQTDMGGGAVYNHVEYYSDSVGSQTENFVEYTPNAEAVPVVVNGASVYGKRTITSAADYMTQNNLRPLVGINGDYFSTKTGIPMGYTIIDGELYSKESGIQDAVGFRADGTAFIDKMGIDASLTYNDKKISIQYVNKWPQDGFSWVYMLTDDYGSTTKTNFNALYVICSAVSGDLSLDSELTLNVDEVFIYDGEISIPEGKYVFVMDPEGDADCYSLLANLAPGNAVTFRNSVYGAERYDWSEAEYAISSIGGRLINNWALGSGFEAGASPRTAVGVKADGTLVLYTLDGRQSGYSYGAQISTIAKRMQELGCIDAINLDGGGSTAIGAVFPGTSEFSVMNQPSDGSLRSCANYLFLRDMREQTGIPWYVEWRDYDNRNYAAGTSLQLEATSVYDTGNYKMDSLTGVTYTVENTGDANSTVDDTGLITFRGTGMTYVNVVGESYSKTFDFAVYEQPDEIRVYDESTGSEVTELTVAEDGMFNVDLEAAAYVNGIRLESYPSLFLWEADGNIGTVDEDGRAAIIDLDGEGGSIRVSMGGTEKVIPVTVAEKELFADMLGHWADDVVNNMAELGIINGFDENGVMVFKPDANITRIQYAAIMCKSLGIDETQYADVELNFTDADQIQEWAVNYVKAMVSLGYIQGRTDDNGKTYYFDPDDNITRAESFTIMGRTLSEDENTVLNYADSSDIPTWAQSSVGKLTALGLINGYEDNTIKPNALSKRAEAASLVSKMIDYNNQIGG